MEGRLGSLKVGDKYPVRIMGIINVSPESFYKKSVKVREEEILEEAYRQLKEGADIIDVGGRSTAPYLETYVDEETERERVTRAIKVLKEGGIKVPISVDTTRSRVAEAALEAGAEIVNDVSGLNDDLSILKSVKEYGASLVIVAKVTEKKTNDPVTDVISALSVSLHKAIKEGIDPEKIVVDPGIGFNRFHDFPWYVWDSIILSNLTQLRKLGRPILVGVSRKSFIGKILNEESPSNRLIGSLSATAIAVYNSAHIIRTHDVRETLKAVRMAEFLRRFREGEIGESN